MDKLKLLQETNRTNELISLELRKYIAGKLPKDLTAKQQLSLILIGNSQVVTAGKIGSVLDISKSSVSQLLARLEKKKLIKREINKNNKKEIYVSLDVLGKECFIDYLETKKSVLLDYFSILSIEEITLLKNLNEKILKNIRSKHDI